MPFTRRSFLATTAFAGATLALPAAAAGPRSLVATTGMIADTARVIGGETFAVKALMGPGVDPHAYRATRSDIVAMTRSDLVLWHGLGLEAQLEPFLGALKERVWVEAVAEGLPEAGLIAHPDYEGKSDPHVWMDPQLWASVARNIAGAMSRADAEGDFALREEAYRGALMGLDAYAEEVLASIDAEARVLVTAHDAFGYFGKRFGFEVMGIQGISTESEAGLSRISELVETLVSRKIRAVFVESTVSDRNMRALIEGAAARGHEVTIGGELYSDAMGPAGSYEGTYLGMIDHNVTTIAGALGGTAPARGMNGKLGEGS